jgi:hypothetical protein
LICPAAGTYAIVSFGVGTCSGSLHVGHLVERPANSRGTLNFMPQLMQENATLGKTTGATIATGAGTTRASLHPEQVVVRPANSGFRLNNLAHLEHEKEIIGQFLKGLHK